MEFEITPNTTWKEIKQESSITTIIHPLTNYPESKEDFEKEFGQMLNKFNGEGKYPTPDSFLGFYVEINPLDRTLKFIDEDCKADFLDLAIEMGLMPSLQEIHQGETQTEYLLRQEQEEWDKIEKLDSVQIREIEKEIALQEEKEREAKQNSIVIQSQKKLEKSLSYSQFYKDFSKMENIWNGYQVKPNLIEFWQDMPFRLHDRVEFRKNKNSWISRKLYP